MILLSDEERMIRDAAAAYCADKLAPRVVTANRAERFDREIMTEMGGLGLLGATIPEEYGGVGANYVSYGWSRVRVREDRFRLPLGHVGPIKPCNASDFRLRNRGATPNLSAQTGQRRNGWLLWIDRA